MKIVINQSYGGYGLSTTALCRYLDIKDIKWEINLDSPYDPVQVDGMSFYDFGIDRDDPALVQVVEELGELSWGRHSELKVVDIPNDVRWQIDDYDGREWIAETHRTWE